MRFNQIKMIFMTVFIFFLSSCGGGGTSSEQGNGMPQVPLALISGKVNVANQNVVGAKVMAFSSSKSRYELPKLIADVTSGSDGRFSITSWKSNPENGDLIYLVATGGEIGGKANKAAVVMSVVGAYGTQIYSNEVYLNEISSIVSADQFSSVLSTAPCGDIASSGEVNTDCPFIISSPPVTWSNYVDKVFNLLDIKNGKIKPSSLSVNGLMNLNMLASVIAECSRVNSYGDNDICGKLFKIPNFLNIGSNFQYVTPDAKKGFVNSSDGKFLFVNDVNKNAISTYINVGGHIFLKGTENTVRPRSLEISPDGKFLFAINDVDETIFVYKNTDGTLNKIGDSVKAQSGAYKILVSGDGKYVFTVSKTNKSIATFIFDNGTLKETGSDFKVESEFNDATISTDGNYIFVRLFWGHDIDIIRNSSGKLQKGSRISVGGSMLGVPAMSDDGKFLYVPDQVGGVVRIYSNKNDVFDEQGAAPLKVGGATEVVINRDGTQLIVATYHESYSIQKNNGFTEENIRKIINVNHLHNYRFSMDEKYAFAFGYTDGVTVLNAGTRNTYSFLTNIKNVPSLVAAKKIFELLPEKPQYMPVPSSIPSDINIK